MAKYIHQRGEGKVGCVLSLALLVILIAVGWQVIPVMFANNSLQNASEAVASRAIHLTEDNINLQIRDKAKELGVREALSPGALTVKKQGGSESGVCIVSFDYVTKVDLYGLYTIPIPTKKTMSIPYMDSTR